MAGILDGVNQRTQLAGNNRLELLLFKLGTSQTYGINVFKVREAISCPPLNQIPESHNNIKGVATIRGQAISIFDLSASLGRRKTEVTKDSFVILTEYNRSVQGFLVSAVERIVNISWSDVMAPPAASGSSNYLTAITKLDDKIVQIVDVEQVLAETLGSHMHVDDDLASEINQHNTDNQKHILAVDDSNVARKQIQRTLEQIGLSVTIAKNGLEALKLLESWVEEGIDVTEKIDLVISDVEMPEMDGYTLTSNIRQNPALAKLPVMLHTSMSGTFNESLVAKVGADKFIPKFSADELATTVQDLLEEVENR